MSKEKANYQKPILRIVSLGSGAGTYLALGDKLLNRVTEFTLHVKAGEPPKIELKMDVDENMFGDLPDYME